MTSVFEASITVQHSSFTPGGTRDSHNNVIDTYADSVERQAISVYPLHRLPHHDVVSSEYVARTMIDFIMEVPDASVYKKQDRVTYNDMVFIVAGYPFNWGENDPFGFGDMFGGSVHIERVT